MVQRLTVNTTLRPAPEVIGESVMSIREDAIRGTLTPLFENCAANENITVQGLIQGVAEGTICIPKNKNHQFDAGDFYFSILFF